MSIKGHVFSQHLNISNHWWLTEKLPEDVNSVLIRMLFNSEQVVKEKIMRMKITDLDDY